MHKSGNPLNHSKTLVVVRPYLMAPTVNDAIVYNNHSNNTDNSEIAFLLNSNSSPSPSPSSYQPSELAPSPCTCIALLLRAHPSDVDPVGLGCRIIFALCGSGDLPVTLGIGSLPLSILTNDDNHSKHRTTGIGTDHGSTSAIVTTTTAITTNSKFKQANAAAKLGEGGVCESLLLVMQQQRMNPTMVALVCRAINHLVSEDQNNNIRWGVGGAVLMDAIDRHSLNVEVRVCIAYMPTGGMNYHCNDIPLMT